MNQQARLIKITALLLGIGLAIWLIFLIVQYIANYNNGTVTLTVVPSDAHVVLDNQTNISLKQNTTSTKLSLKPGTYTITASRTGFAAKSLSVTIKQRQAQSPSLILGFTDENAAAAYYAAHPDQATIVDAIGQQQVEQNGQIISQNNPLINILPYVGANFRIDFGVSQAHPNDHDAVAIYITASTPAGQANALKWIRAHGYDPNAYEIIYQTTAQ